jgi:hypothetical protein
VFAAVAIPADRTGCCCTNSGVPQSQPRWAWRRISRSRT